MHPPSKSQTAGRLLAIFVMALSATACGSAGAGSSALAPASSTPTTSSAPAGTGTGTQTATSTTTPALPGTGKPPIVVGDKNYTEQFVLGQLYLQALTAEGFSVTLNQNIGPTQVTVQALKDGSLSMYPEYLGEFDSAVAAYRHGFRTQLAAFLAAEHYAVGHGLELLPMTPFSDTNGIAVTDAYAAANNLHSIGDLRRVARTLTLAGPPQFQQDAPGLPALRQAYGVVPTAFTGMAVGDQYAALDDATVQAAYVNTTDGQLASGDYQVLADPRRIFPWGNVVPVVSAKVMDTEGPAFAAAIERVDDELTTDAMRQMNEAVDIAQQNPADVAKQFLETHGLLTPAPY